MPVPRFPATEASAAGPAAAARLEAAFDLAYYTPIQDFRNAADTKAGAILTVAGILFTVLARYAAHLAVLLQGTGVWHLIAAALLAVFTLLSLAAVVYAFQTISPRFPDAPHSLAFFADIAALSHDEYVRRVEGMAAEEALEQLLLYNHTSAAIVVEKFRQLRPAVRCCEWAFVCWAVLMTIVAVHVLL